VREESSNSNFTAINSAFKSSSGKDSSDNSTQQPIKKFINMLSEVKNKVGVLPPLHQIPCASIVTFNPTSLSHYTNNQNRINNTLAKFAKKYDIIFLQETKLLAREKKALNCVLSGHEVFFSNNPSNTGAKASTHTAGICTAISRKISKRYDIKTLSAARLGELLRPYRSAAALRGGFQGGGQCTFWWLAERVP
jgi:hypothetical protein